MVSERIRRQHAKCRKYHFAAMNEIFFLILCRFYFRLYVFPYKVLYPSGHLAVEMLPHAPFYYFFNGLLLFLFLMNLWWFHFIILLIWRVATGKSPEVEDVREVGTPQVCVA